MKVNTKKLLALLLSLIMVLTMLPATVFAANTPAPTGATFSVTKIDEKNEPLAGAVFHLTAVGQTPYEAISDADGKVTFTGVADGTYTLSEYAAPAGYEKTPTTVEFRVTNSEVEYWNDRQQYAPYGNGLSIQNTPTATQPAPTTSVTVNKVWAGTLPEGQSHPTSVKVYLTANDKTVQEATLTDINQWTYTWENLDVNDQSGFPITYGVEEETVSGYTPSIEKNATVVNGFTITNTYDGGGANPGGGGGNYGITVVNGKSYVGGTEVSAAAEGDVVTIEADAAPAGKVFDKWVVDYGTITLADETAAETTFTMPAERVQVTATYKDDGGNTPAAPVTIEIPVRKAVSSNDAFSGNETFTFEIEFFNSNVNEDELTITGDSVTVTSNEGGSTTIEIVVPANEIANVCDEGLKITEKSGSAEGWTYDDAEYYVRITPTNNGYSLEYSLDDSFTTLENGVVFTNGYTAPSGGGGGNTPAAPVTIEIPVRKAVSSNDAFSGNETFTFEIEICNANVNEDELTITGDSVTVTSNEGGSTTIEIVVPANEIANVCDEGLKITEKSGSAEGWTYDDAEYYVRITPTNNGYSLEYSLDDSFTTLENGVVFTNGYTAPSGGNTNPNPNPDRPTRPSYPSNPSYPSITPDTDSGETIAPPKTFDGGIGLAIAVTALSAMGGAWLAKKKED